MDAVIGMLTFAMLAGQQQQQWLVNAPAGSHLESRSVCFVEISKLNLCAKLLSAKCQTDANTVNSSQARLRREDKNTADYFLSTRLRFMCGDLHERSEATIHFFFSCSQRLMWPISVFVIANAT